MVIAKYNTDTTITFGPVLAADGTMSSAALAYTDFKIFKNGTDGALNSSATATHKYEGVYALLLKAADLSAVGMAEVCLNKNPLSAAVVKILVLTAQVYDSWLGNDLLDVNVAKVNETSQTARDLGLALPAVAPGGKGGLPITDASTGLVLTGYGGGAMQARADLISILATALSETTAGNLAACFKVLLDVASGSRNLTVASQNLTVTPAAVGAKMDLADSLNQTGVTDLKSKLGTVPASGNWNTTTPPAVSEIRTELETAGGILALTYTAAGNAATNADAAHTAADSAYSAAGNAQASAGTAATNAEDAKTAALAAETAAGNAKTAADAVATILTGITSLGAWIRGFFRKDAMNSTAKTEVNSGGGTYNEATDSLEAIRDTAPLGTAMRGTDNAYTGTPPTADAIGTDAASKVLVTPAQKIATDANGKVTYSNAAPLTAQQARDAMKLAPTTGDPAVGSVDKHLDDLVPGSPVNLSIDGTEITASDT